MYRRCNRQLSSAKRYHRSIVFKSRVRENVFCGYYETTDSINVWNSPRNVTRENVRLEGNVLEMRFYGVGGRCYVIACLVVYERNSMLLPPVWEQWLVYVRVIGEAGYGLD